MSIVIHRAAIVAGGAVATLAWLQGVGGAQQNPASPTPTPPVCMRPNVAPSVVQAAPAVTPLLAEERGIHGTVQVVVSLDPDSNIVGAQIRSSPSPMLNRAALEAARQSTFQTQILACRLIAADFVVSYDFVNKVTFATANSGERTVSAIGEGVVTRPADSAVVLATIVTRDATAANATAQNDALFDALRAKVAALGIGERKISWTLSVYSRASPTPGAGSEYMNTRALRITVDEAANAGRAAAAAASVASAQAIAIRYELNNRDAADREAFKIALKDAENAARSAAAGQQSHLGSALGAPAVVASSRVVKVTSYNRPIVGGFTEPDIRVPDLEVRVTATVTYAFKP